MKQLSGFPCITPGLALALLLAASPPVLGATDAQVQQLEQRVAELEALVKSLLPATAKSAPAPAPPARAVAAESAKAFKIGGYVKADAIISDYSAGDLAPGSIGTTFYVPATIPVGDSSGSETPSTDFQARETRVNVSSTHNLDNGDTVKTFAEVDFMVNSGGNERISNSHNARLRHAFIQYNNWLFGQTWLTFQDVGALPENLDFVGPAEGTVFGRQAMVRYTRGNWEFALENPETTITPFGGGSRIVTDDGWTPDMTVRYTARLQNGYVKIAGLARQLAYESGSIDDTEMAYGLSLSGKHSLGRDDFRWMATVGSGTGRYLGLNTSNDAVLDAAGKLNAIDQFGGFASLRHFWNDKWRSNFTLSYLTMDNDILLTGLQVTREVYSVHANLLYEPVPKMMVGGELIYAQREIESGLDGSMTRFMFSARYGF